MTLSHHTITSTNTPKSNQRKYMFQMLASLVYFVFVSQRRFSPNAYWFAPIFILFLARHHFTRIYRNKEHIEMEGETKIVKKAQNLCYEKHCRANVCAFISFFDLRTVRWIFMYVQDFHFFGFPFQCTFAHPYIHARPSFLSYTQHPYIWNFASLCCDLPCFYFFFFVFGTLSSRAHSIPVTYVD